MIVVDASAVIELLLRSERGDRVAEIMLRPAESLHAPHLLDVEVVQVIRKFWKIGELSASRADEAILLFAELPIRRHPHEPLIPRIWELRHNLTAYDAAYIALAEGLGAPLLTSDRRLAAARAHHAQVTLV